MQSHQPIFTLNMNNALFPYTYVVRTGEIMNDTLRTIPNQSLYTLNTYVQIPVCPIMGRMEVINGSGVHTIE